MRISDWIKKNKLITGIVVVIILVLYLVLTQSKKPVAETQEGAAVTTPEAGASSGTPETAPTTDIITPEVVGEETPPEDTI